MVEITFTGTYNRKQIHRVADVNIEEKIDLAAFLASLLYEIPSRPSILSYKKDSGGIFLPLALSSHKIKWKDGALQLPRAMWTYHSFFLQFFWVQFQSL
jgi:hypothetical protein